jgi:hypothetical protein
MMDRWLKFLSSVQPCMMNVTRCFLDLPHAIVARYSIHLVQLATCLMTDDAVLYAVQCHIFTAVETLKDRMSTEPVAALSPQRCSSLCVIHG